MTSASLGLTATELFELAFCETRKRVDQSRQINRQLQAAWRMKSLVSRASSVKALLSAVFGKPEAVVKHVRNAHELRRQIADITKQLLEGETPVIAKGANLLREADVFGRDISSKHDDQVSQAFVRAIATRWSAREGLGSLNEMFQK